MLPCISFREKSFKKWASTVCSVLETFAEGFSLVATEGCTLLSVDKGTKWSALVIIRVIKIP